MSFGKELVFHELGTFLMCVSLLMTLFGVDCLEEGERGGGTNEKGQVLRRTGFGGFAKDLHHTLWRE